MGALAIPDSPVLDRARMERLIAALPHCDTCDNEGVRGEWRALTLQDVLDYYANHSLLVLE